MSEVDRLPLEYPFRQALGIYGERSWIFLRHLVIALTLSVGIFGVTHGLIRLTALWTLHPQAVSFAAGMVMVIVAGVIMIRSDSHELQGAAYTSPFAFGFILLYAWLNRNSSFSMFVFNMLVPGVFLWIVLFFVVLGFRNLIRTLVGKWRVRNASRHTDQL